MNFKFCDWLLIYGVLIIWPLGVWSETQSVPFKLQLNSKEYVGEQIQNLSSPEASTRLASIHHLSIALEDSTELLLSFGNVTSFDIQNRFVEMALHDASVQVRLVSVWALGQLVLHNNSTDFEIQTKIAQLLTDPSVSIQKATINTLGKMSVSDLGIQKSLSEFLSHSSQELVMETLFALEKIQPQDRSIGQKITKLVDHPDESIRVQAISLLANIRPTDSVIQRSLIKAISDSSLTVSFQALRTLSSIAKSSPYSSVPVFKPVILRKLTSILDSETNSLKKLEILNIFSHIQPLDPVVVRTLTPLLKDINTDIRAKAGEVLIKNNGYHLETQQMVAQLLKDPSEKVRKTIIQVFLDFQVQNFEVLDASVRKLITQALGDKKSIETNKQGGIRCEKVFS